MIRHVRCYRHDQCGLDQACLQYAKSRGIVYKRCYYRDFGEEVPTEEPTEEPNTCNVKFEINGKCGAN